MNSSVGFQAPRASLSLSPATPCCKSSLGIVSKQKLGARISPKRVKAALDLSGIEIKRAKRTGLCVQLGGILATFVHPALAVTGVNYEPELTSVVIQLGLVAVLYFIVMPPIIMNWMRIRWYRRNLFEMYLQFMCVFIFFPGVLVWAPFLNFRKFPRDPDMKYPWDKPKDPSKIKNAYLKYPFAQPEDYD